MGKSHVGSEGLALQHRQTAITRCSYSRVNEKRGFRVDRASPKTHPVPEIAAARARRRAPPPTDSRFARYRATAARARPTNYRAYCSRRPVPKRRATTRSRPSRAWPRRNTRRRSPAVAAMRENGNFEHPVAFAATDDVELDVDEVVIARKLEELVELARKDLRRSVDVPVGEVEQGAAFQVVE